MGVWTRALSALRSNANRFYIYNAYIKVCVASQTVTKTTHTWLITCLRGTQGYNLFKRVDWNLRFPVVIVLMSRTTHQANVFKVRQQLFSLFPTCCCCGCCRRHYLFIIFVVWKAGPRLTTPSLIVTVRLDQETTNIYCALFFLLRQEENSKSSFEKKTGETKKDSPNYFADRVLLFVPVIFPDSLSLKKEPCAALQ